MSGLDRGPGPEKEAAARSEAVRTMFGRIVPRYDLMNRVMTAGMDGHWRRRAAAAARPEGGLVLDLGAGTGDLARELDRQGARRVVAADFSRTMLRAGRRKAGQRENPEVDWVQADGLRLPFADDSFDALTSGFLLRNLVDLPAGLAEMVRVLKPGGRLVALDLTHPRPGATGRVLRLGFERVMAPLAGLLSGDRAAYGYLPRSLDGFPTAQELAQMLERAGAEGVGVQRLGGGMMALHSARKPERA